MITLYIYNKTSGLLSYRDSGLINSVVKDIPEGYDFTLIAPPDISEPYIWNGSEWEISKGVSVS